jgi:hypothetical protein
LFEDSRSVDVVQTVNASSGVVQFGSKEEGRKEGAREVIGKHSLVTLEESHTYLRASWDREILAT